jgi:hypothetical protein
MNMRASHHVQMLIEGGFSQSFVETIDDALNAYYAHPEKFDSVIGNTDCCVQAQRKIR